MNYYNIDLLAKKMLKKMRKEGGSDFFELCPFKYGNLGDNKHVDIMFSRSKVYISEKSVLMKLFDFKDKLEARGCDIDFSSLTIDDAKIDTDNLEKDDHLVNFSGKLPNFRAFNFLKNLAKKEINSNPYYLYFKDLSEMENNKEKCISLDCEFSPTHGVTELGATYYENNQLTTKWFRIKGTPNRHKPSNFNRDAEMIDLKQMKRLMERYHKDFDTFIFHDFQAEKTIFRNLFKGVEGTPFDGTKKIVDTMRASLYIKQRDEEHANKGYDDTLKGLCMATNVKASGFHNAANDTRFTFNVAEKLSKKYKHKWEQYLDRDENNPIQRRKKITLKG